MTSTDQAFIRAYVREHGSAPAETTVPPPGTPAAGFRPAEAGEHEFRPFVQVVGTETAAAETLNQHPVEIPTRPIFPSSLRHQQQYYRHDPIAYAPQAGDRPMAPPPHFAEPRSTREPVVAEAPWPGGPSWQEGSQLYPKTTVSELRYPAICQQLAEQYPGVFDHATDSIGEMIEAGRSLVGVASCFPQAGCTTTLLSLAQKLAARGWTVTVVDANFVRPALAERLDVRPTAYWQDVLMRGVPLAEVLVRSAADGLNLVPSAPAHLANRTTVGNLQPSVTAGALRYASDITLVDLGAVLDPQQSAVALNIVSAMRVDGVLLVIDANQTSSSDVHHTEQLVGECRCQVVGMMENFT